MVGMIDRKIDDFIESLQQKIGKELEKTSIPVTLKWGGFGRNYPYIIVHYSYSILNPSERRIEKTKEDWKETIKKIDSLKDGKKKRELQGFIKILKEGGMSIAGRKINPFEIKGGKTSAFQIEVWTNTEKERDVIGKSVLEILKSINLGKNIKTEITGNVNLGSTRRSMNLNVTFPYEMTSEELKEEDKGHEEMEFKNKIEGIIDFYPMHYNLSPNKKYTVACCDGHHVKNKWKNGIIALIVDMKKVFWKKEIERPNEIFVNNNGIVAVIDWTYKKGVFEDKRLSFEKETKLLGSKLWFFDKNGKKVGEFVFDSNTCGSDISNDAKELIITTAFPENAIYLFDTKNKKLIKKINNTTPNRPLTKFDFDDIKKIVLKERKYFKKEFVEKEDRLNPFEELLIKGYQCRNEGKFEKGIKYFMKAIRIKKTGSLLKGIGYCYMGLGKFEKAIKFFKEAMEISPYQRTLLPKYIELCKKKKKGFEMEFKF
jgi:hypothetical protein